MNKPRIFISHAWTSNNQYEGLTNLLKERGYFDFYNHSVPKTAPLDVNTDKALLDGIIAQMKNCQVILIIADMHYNSREWIQKEIELAYEWGKPIIGVMPQGQQKLPVELQDKCTEFVRWNADSIVEAIRKHIK